jgi:glycosyltransferase involved in cell wall biosynthesis
LYNIKREVIQQKTLTYILWRDLTKSYKKCYNKSNKSLKGGDVMKLSLVVPCFNEEDNVEKFLQEVKNTFKNDIDYEIVFVNDGSTDKTHKVLKKLAKENGNVQVITFSRNFGKEAAMYAGLKASYGDVVCVIDADLQQHPQVVLEMMEILDNNPDTDCVTAYQEKRREGLLMSGIKSVFYKLINAISDVNFVNGASDFRLMRRTMVEAVLSITEYHRFSKGIFSWVGFST